MHWDNVDFNKIFKSKVFKGVLIGIGALIILLVLIGVALGIDHHRRSFGFDRRGFANQMPMMQRGGERQGGVSQNFYNDGHGIFGPITKIEGSIITIKGPNNLEQTINVDDSTAIRKNQETLKATDLKVDDNITVVGMPDSTGQIVAKLIRVMPAMPGNRPMPQGLQNAPQAPMVPPASPTIAPTGDINQN